MTTETYSIYTANGADLGHYTVNRPTRRRHFTCGDHEGRTAGKVAARAALADVSARGDDVDPSSVHYSVRTSCGHCGASASKAFGQHGGDLTCAVCGSVNGVRKVADQSDDCPEWALIRYGYKRAAGVVVDVFRGSAEYANNSVRGQQTVLQSGRWGIGDELSFDESGTVDGRLG